jgi:hypothetical protein
MMLYRACLLCLRWDLQLLRPKFQTAISLTRVDTIDLGEECGIGDGGSGRSTRETKPGSECAERVAMR